MAKKREVPLVETTAPVEKPTVLSTALGAGSQDYGDEDGEQARDVTEDTLAALQRLAQEVVDGERDVEAKEKALKAAAASLAEVQENRLPKLMQQYGLPKFDFIDGVTKLKRTIKLEDKLRVAMPTKKIGNKFVADIAAARPVYAWLREIGEGESIKKNVEIPAGLMDYEKVVNLMDHIKNFDNMLEPGFSEKIEPATLTALVTRLRKDGKNVHEAVKVTPVFKASVSTK